MSRNEAPRYFTEEDLLDRLTDGATEAGREVVFVVGAPLTAGSVNAPGVPDVVAVVELIRSYFSSDERKLADLDAQLAGAGNAYQTAFDFLQGRRGQDGANRLIKQAVWAARKGSEAGKAIDTLSKLTDEQFRTLDEDDAWELSPAVQALGELATANPEVFGRTIVTSNFDPLIEVAIRRAGGQAWRTSLHVDGALGLSRAQGCQVVHIHGYWWGSDTLHTGNQLIQNRPQLKTSLSDMLTGKTIVVMAYGGWDDILTQTLEGLVSNPGAFPEVIWSFYDQAPILSDHLKRILGPGIARNRVTFYAGIDCRTFLPKLAAEWTQREAKASASGSSAPDVSQRSILRARLPLLATLDCDRPPNIDTWVGREDEISVLDSSSANFVVICGIGGQGKSVLAARYLKGISEDASAFDYWDWRDCKEESDRIRSQVVAALVRVSGGTILSADLAEATELDLAEIFVRQSMDRRIVFVFDNVDHYVDLERNTFVGLLDVLIRAFCRSTTKSRLIVTCRPTVKYEAATAITLTMPGLSLSETIDLFSKRSVGRKEDERDIAAAHALTKGHAFWLDLMAAQVARNDGKTLKSLLEDVRRGRGDAPDILSSIWAVLPEREKMVLRAMAETVRPEIESTIEQIVSSELNYQKFKKAMKSLISLNLIVVKPEKNSPDLYDLHPLVRQFVKRTFERPERVGFIEIVLKHYDGLIRGVAALLGVHMPYSMLERWSQKAELEIEAGLFPKAFITLDQAHGALVGGGHNEEFIRVARKLFEAVNWSEASSKIKNFDDVLADYIFALEAIEQRADVDDLLRRYQETIPAKTARYIKYCDVRCHALWMRRDFETAIEWGRTGDELKRATNVDTKFDCEHNLALAMRDGGDPAGALKLFLGSVELEQVIADCEVEGERRHSGALFGNVGRCLFLMGRIDEALRCFRRSGRILEDDGSEARISNQAYARQWIGEALAAAGELRTARAFLVAAEDTLRNSLPARARRIREFMQGLDCADDEAEPTIAIANRTVKHWLNRTADDRSTNDNRRTANVI